MIILEIGLRSSFALQVRIRGKTPLYLGGFYGIIGG